MFFVSIRKRSKRLPFRVLQLPPAGQTWVRLKERGSFEEAGRCVLRSWYGANTLSALDRVSVGPDPAAWRALALAVTLAATDLIIADRRAASIVTALWMRGAPASLHCDELVTGRIGGHDLRAGALRSWRSAQSRPVISCGPAAPVKRRPRCGPASPSGRCSGNSTA